MPRYAIFLRRAAILALAAGAVACHSGHSSNVATNPQEAYGVWTGTDVGSNLGLTGIVTSLDYAVFIRADGVVYTGTNAGLATIAVLQGAVSGQMHGYSPLGGMFPDGSTFGIGTLGGSVTTGATLDATWNFTTVANPTNMSNTTGSTTTTQWTLAYESAYTGVPTLSAIAGNYADATTTPGDPSEGSTVAITSSGAMTGQSATTGCVLNGQVTATDTLNLIYQFSYSYASCTGRYAVLNGVQLTGYGAFNPNATQTQTAIILAVSGQASSTQTNYGLTLSLTKS